MARKTTTLTFSFERETKGAVRYFESDKQGNKIPYGEFAIGILYLRKDKLGGKIPQVVNVDINIDV